MPLKVNPDSLKFTIRSIGNVAVSLRKAGKASVRAAGQALAKQVRYNVSATDHTLEDLADMDHPYAKRHGTIQPIHQTQALDVGSMRDPRHVVHRRSGEMKDSVKSAAVQGGRSGPIEWNVWFNTAGSDHIQEVLSGTPLMLPRDPLWETAMGPSTLIAMRKAIVLELGKALRSQATIRFGGSP